MEINTNIKTYTNNPTVTSATKGQSLNEFALNLAPEMYINTELIDEITKNISQFSYEDAKQYKPQIDEFFKQKGITDETPLSSMVFMAFPWITTINLTNDESFNKTLFDTVKTKEDPQTSDGFMFMLETIHNMEYAVGKKEYPWGILTLDEAYGNSPYLSKSEAKQTDAANFFDKVIRAYAKANTAVKLKIIGEIINPQLIERGFYYSEATFDKPTTNATWTYGAYVKIHSMAIVDSNGKEWIIGSQSE